MTRKNKKKPMGNPNSKVNNEVQIVNIQEALARHEQTKQEIIKLANDYFTNMEDVPLVKSEEKDGIMIRQTNDPLPLTICE